MAEISIELELLTSFRWMIKELQRIKSELNFSLVVEEGITRIRAAQRQAAPIGKTGKGPHGRIPKSIQQSNVMEFRGEQWEATSTTSYGPAIFTNEGTRSYMMWNGGRHPGLQAQGWWEKGTAIGEPLALRAFEEKVERVLRIRRL